jgi:phosphoglucomutase
MSTNPLADRPAPKSLLVDPDQLEAAFYKNRLKVVSPSGWFAGRPSGTEHLYKLYAESLQSPAHLGTIVEQAKEIVSSALGGT